MGLHSTRCLMSSGVQEVAEESQILKEYGGICRVVSRRVPLPYATFNQGVMGSNPIGLTNDNKDL